MATLEEVQRGIKVARDRVRCVLSDQDRCVRRVYQEHWLHYRSACDRLARLRDKFRRANQLVAEYEGLIEQHEARLRLCHNEKGVRKMLLLVARANCWDKKRTKALLNRYKSSREEVTTLAYLITGYRNEIAVIRKLLANDGRVFRQREAELKAAVDRQGAAFELFLRHRVDSEAILERQYAAIDELRRQEVALGSDRKVQRLNTKFEELMQLMLSMPKELVAAALNGKGH